MLAQTNTKGVPRNAVLIASAAGFLAVVANYFLGTKAVFNFLLNSSGATAVIVFPVHRYVADHEPPTPEQGRACPAAVRRWGFPHLSILVVVSLLIIIGGMAFTESNRESLILTLIVAGLAGVIGLFVQRRQPQAIK